MFMFSRRYLIAFPSTISVASAFIVENRPHYGESVDNLNDINDIRNGVFAYSGIRYGFEMRMADILKVCRTLCPTLNTFSPSLALIGRPPLVFVNSLTKSHILLTVDIRSNG